MPYVGAAVPPELVMSVFRMSPTQISVYLLHLAALVTVVLTCTCFDTIHLCESSRGSNILLQPFQILNGGRRFIGWAERRIRVSPGFTWSAGFMETAGAPGCFFFNIWYMAVFLGITWFQESSEALTVPQGEAVNPWTERDTRNTRWISWRIYGKMIRCVSVCDSF